MERLTFRRVSESYLAVFLVLDLHGVSELSTIICEGLQPVQLFIILSRREQRVKEYSKPIVLASVAKDAITNLVLVDVPEIIQS